MGKKVSIKNIANMRVGLTVPAIRLNRVIEPGKTISLDEEILEEAMGFHGVEQLFAQQLLAIPETEARKSLEHTGVKVDLDPEETLDKDAIIKLLETGTDLEVKKLLEKASKARKDMVATLAIREAKDLSYSKAKLIEDATGTDVFKARKEFEAPDDEPTVRMEV